MEHKFRQGDVVGWDGKECLGIFLYYRSVGEIMSDLAKENKEFEKSVDLAKSLGLDEILPFDQVCRVAIMTGDNEWTHIDVDEKKLTRSTVGTMKLHKLYAAWERKQNENPSE